MEKWQIEFWPGKTFTVEYEAEAAEEDVLADFINQHGWPGGCEHTSHGVEFKVWVRKVSK